MSGGRGHESSGTAFLKSSLGVEQTLLGRPRALFPNCHPKGLPRGCPGSCCNGSPQTSSGFAALGRDLACSLSLRVAAGRSCLSVCLYHWPPALLRSTFPRAPRFPRSPSGRAGAGLPGAGLAGLVTHTAAPPAPGAGVAPARGAHACSCELRAPPPPHRPPLPPPLPPRSLPRSLSSSLARSLLARRVLKLGGWQPGDSARGPGAAQPRAPRPAPRPSAAHTCGGW